MAEVVSYSLNLWDSLIFSYIKSKEQQRKAGKYNLKIQ